MTSGNYPLIQKIPVKILDGGRKIRVAGRKIPDVGRKIRVAGRKIPDAGRKISGVGRKIPIVHFGFMRISLLFYNNKRDCSNGLF